MVSIGRRCRDLHNATVPIVVTMAALKALKIKWGCQSTMFLADDEEMSILRPVGVAACRILGMESLDELDETNKPVNEFQKFSREDQDVPQLRDHGDPGCVRIDSRL